MDRNDPLVVCVVHVVASASHPQTSSRQRLFRFQSYGNLVPHQCYASQVNFLSTRQHVRRFSKPSTAPFVLSKFHLFSQQSKRALLDLLRVVNDKSDPISFFASGLYLKRRQFYTLVSSACDHNSIGIRPHPTRHSSQYDFVYCHFQLRLQMFRLIASLSSWFVSTAETLSRGIIHQ